MRTSMRRGRHKEAGRQRKCARCGVLLDVACSHEGCPGHHNERLGDVCRYCATNERETSLHLRDLSLRFLSTLADAREEYTAEGTYTEASDRYRQGRKRAI